MRARTLSLVTILVGSFLALPARSAPQLKAGLWQVTVDVSDSGSGMKLPSSIQTQCLSQAEVDADPSLGVEKGSCRATNVLRSGDKVTWDLDCGETGKGHGEVSYKSPTLYEGFMTMEMAGTTVRATIKALRVGDC